MHLSQNSMQSIDKRKVILAVIEKIEAEMNVLRAAIQDAHTAATHEETQAKSKYDTFALESSYLANGQTKRFGELEAALTYFKSIQSAPVSQRIGFNTLVRLSKNEKEPSTVLLAKHGGGIQVQVGKESITVITDASPLGGQLMGANRGDVFEIKAKGLETEYEVIDFG